MAFKLQVNVHVSIPCFCGQTVAVQQSGLTDTEFTVTCPECGSEYGIRVDEKGAVSVIGIRVSEKAKDDKVVAATCETLGVNPVKLRVKNGRGDVDLVRFAKVLLAQSEDIEHQIKAYQQV